MENASKALLIAAEVLLGVLIITVLVYAFTSGNAFSESYGETMDTQAIQEFNVQFEKYMGRKDLAAQDIITVANLAKKYNIKRGLYDEETGNWDESNSQFIRVIYKTTNYAKAESSAKDQFLSDNLTNPIYYKVESTDIAYDSTGRVNYIKFTNN